MTAVSEIELPAPDPLAMPRPLMTGVDALATAGIKKNRNCHFTFTLSGTEVYETLQLLEQSALAESKCFATLRCFCLAAEVIRNQANAQGFGLAAKKSNDDLP